MPTDHFKAAHALRGFAMGLPGAWEDFPWGERVVKVGTKVFVFMGRTETDAKTFGLSCKLPESGDAALELPFAQPTGYGLGKAGWVSAKFEGGQAPPVELLRSWIEESYRAVAPKRLVAQMGMAAPAAKTKAKRTTKKAPAKRARPGS